MTETDTSKIALWCKLKEPFVTENAEFIPAGTPCEICRWSKDPPHLPDKNARLVIRPVAMMAAKDEGCDIRKGQEMEVTVDQIEYLAHWTPSVETRLLREEG